MEKTEKKQTIIGRYLSICIIAGIAFIAVIARIVIIQTKEYDRWMKEAAKQKKTDIEVAPSRGNIYASDGRLMASSLPTYTIYMDPCTDWYMQSNSDTFMCYLDTMCYGLHKIFPDVSQEEFRNKILTAHNTPINGKPTRSLRLYPKEISYQKLKDVRALVPFNKGRYAGGLSWVEQKKRKQPFGSLGRRTLGSVYAQTDTAKGMIEGNGSSGLELYYNDLLKGTPGLSIKQRVASKDAYEIVKPAVNGCDIYTTLDIDLLDITEYALHKKLIYSEADWGCAVLMETKSGDIKAITNLKRGKDGTYFEGENYAAQAVEPGSTFKTLSLIAAVDDNLIDLTDSISTGNGSWVYKDPKFPIRDTHSNGTVTAGQAITVSSNIALAKIITSRYKENTKKYVAKLKSMGLGEPIEIAIPGAHKVKIEVPEDKESLARMAYGYAVEVPPVYMLTYYNAIANHGTIVQPKLVNEIRRGLDIVKHYDTKVMNSQMCKQSTLEAIKPYLDSVVWSAKGTARAAQSDTVRIAGKTGTARLLVNGNYDPNRHRVTFCGFFPSENPQYTCICVISNPKRGGAGFLCGSAVKEIAEHTMAIKGTVPLDDINAADSLAMPRVKTGNLKATQRALRQIDIKLKGMNTDSTGWGKVDGDMLVSNIEVRPYFVPNLIGMGAKDAVFAIEQTGMKAHISGQGRVVKQSVPAGVAAIQGGTIYIELR